MSWQPIVTPALTLAGVVGMLGAWWLLEDLILDRVPVPCTRRPERAAADSRER